MDNTLQFSYNKVFAFTVVSILLSIFFILVSRTFELGYINPESRKVLVYSDIFLFILIFYFVMKFVIPAIKKQSALEVNTEGIQDNVRNRFINWENIKSFEKIKFRNSSSGIAVYLIDKEIFISELNFWQKILAWLSDSDYDTPVVIPLQYISGNNSEIMKSVQLYFEEIKKY